MTRIPTPGQRADAGAVLRRLSESDGRQFTPRERIPTEGLPRHPQIAIDSRGSVVAAWDEQVKGTRRVVVGRAIVNGRGPARFTHEILGAAGAVYPAVAAVADGVAVAWTNGPPQASVIRVERLAGNRMRIARQRSVHDETRSEPEHSGSLSGAP